MVNPQPVIEWTIDGESIQGLHYIQTEILPEEPIDNMEVVTSFIISVVWPPEPSTQHSLVIPGESRGRSDLNFLESRNQTEVRVTRITATAEDQHMVTDIASTVFIHF